MEICHPRTEVVPLRFSGAAPGVIRRPRVFSVLAIWLLFGIVGAVAFSSTAHRVQCALAFSPVSFSLHRESHVGTMSQFSPLLAVLPGADATDHA